MFDEKRGERERRRRERERREERKGESLSDASESSSCVVIQFSNIKISPFNIDNVIYLFISFDFSFLFARKELFILLGSQRAVGCLFD